MKNISKIFGAVAIIGLFLICSMSTGLAAIAQKQTLVAQPSYQIATYGDGTYVDGAYPIGLPDETSPYPLTTPVNGHDYCTVIIACFPLTDMLLIRVRNIGTSVGCGGQAVIRVHAFVSGHFLAIFNVERALEALPAWLLADTFVEGPVSFTQPVHLVTVKLQLPFGEYEGLIRGLNYRAGFVQAII